MLITFSLGLIKCVLIKYVTNLAKCLNKCIRHSPAVSFKDKLSAFFRHTMNYSVKWQRWAHGHFSCHSKCLICRLSFSFEVKDSSHFSCVQPIRKYRLFLNTVSFGILGSLRNDDGDGNENDKKAIGLISKTTTLHVHCASCNFLFRRCTTTTWNCVITPNFSFHGEQEDRTRIFFFFI